MAQPRQIPIPQAMRRSMDSWQGTPCAAARSATDSSSPSGPQENTASTLRQQGVQRGGKGGAVFTAGNVQPFPEGKRLQQCRVPPGRKQQTHPLPLVQQAPGQETHGGQADPARNQETVPCVRFPGKAAAQRPQYVDLHSRRPAGHILRAPAHGTYQKRKGLRPVGVKETDRAAQEGVAAAGELQFHKLAGQGGPSDCGAGKAIQGVPRRHRAQLGQSHEHGDPPQMRATPLSRAARATAAATVLPTRGSKAAGMM